MKSEILYESHHPHIIISHNHDTGEIVLNRADKYMRNPERTTPPFIPERVVLINIKEVI